MTAIVPLLMVLLLVAGLERNHRRQRPFPPGPYGTHDHIDRDWARTQLDLMASGDQPSWKTSRHNGPRAAEPFPGVSPQPTAHVRA